MSSCPALRLFSFINSKHMLRRLSAFSRGVRNFSMSSEPTITLYTAQTPNGVKISIALEELGLKYKVRKLVFSKNEQKEPWFEEINPNGRIPAITDIFPKDGKPIHIFESGGILKYLVETYDKDYKLSYPPGTREYYEMWNWVFFQNAGVGPMQGQANHFQRYAAEEIPYAQNRYSNETRRLYSVLNKHLSKSTSGYIVGDRATVADVTTFGWASWASYAKVDISDFEHVQNWLKLMEARPGVDKGRDVPDGDIIRNKTSLDEKAEESKKWIQEGMKADAKRK